MKIWSTNRYTNAPCPVFRRPGNRIGTHVTLSYEPTVGNWLTSFTARCDAGSLRGFIIFRIGSEALSLLTKAAPGFNGRVTLYIESSLPYIFVKVTCGAARLLSLYHNTLDLLAEAPGTLPGVSCPHVVGTTGFEPVTPCL